MKTSIFLLLTCVGLCCAGKAQPLVCTRPGTEFEYAEYNANGKLEGYTRMVVEQCDSTGEGVRILNRFIALDAQHDRLGIGLKAGCTVDGDWKHVYYDCGARW